MIPPVDGDGSGRRLTETCGSIMGALLVHYKYRLSIPGNNKKAWIAGAHGHRL
jgi:hypothetical protein